MSFRPVDTICHHFPRYDRTKQESHSGRSSYSQTNKSQRCLLEVLSQIPSFWHIFTGSKHEVVCWAQEMTRTWVTEKYHHKIKVHGRTHRAGRLTTCRGTTASNFRMTVWCLRNFGFLNLFFHLVLLFSVFHFFKWVKRYLVVVKIHNLEIQVFFL